MNGKHLIVGAVMTAISLLALAAPESASSQPGHPASAKPAQTAPQIKPATAKKPQAGKTRNLKSKKKMECNGTSYCE